MVSAARQLIGAVIAAAVMCCGGARPKADGPPVLLVVPSVDGGDITVGEYRGQVVILHVFATWAPAAHGDVDQLSQVHRQHDRDAAVIGIAVDTEGRRFVAPWRRVVGARYPIGVASDAIRGGQTALGPIHEVPITVILDREGRLVHRIARPLQPGELLPLVRALM